MNRIRIVIALCAAIGVVAALATVSSAADKKLYAKMSGKQEKPTGDPNGSGSATLTLKARQVCYVIRLRNVNSPLGAGHIHAGRRGVAGDVYIALFTKPKTIRNGRISGCSPTVSAARIAKVRKTPANYYLNVHNAQFGPGAVRGQLTAKKPS